MIFWRKNNKKDGEKGSEKPAAQPPAETAPAAPPEKPATTVAMREQEAATLVSATPSNWLSRLSRGLTKSSSKFTKGIADLITKRKLDQEMLDQLEELLITADLGPKTAAKLVEEFGRDRFGKDISGVEVAEALAASIAKILTPVAKPIDLHRHQDGPMTVLVCGVNGVGKTTTIGKIAYDLQQFKCGP